MADVKPEIDMNINSFNDTQMLGNLDALGARLQNLILQENGTISTNYTMGCSIARYIYEPMHSNLWSEIQNLISTQIKKYLPDIELGDVSITVGDEYNGKVLNVLITMKNVIDGSNQLNMKVFEGATGSISTEVYA